MEGLSRQRMFWTEGEDGVREGGERDWGVGVKTHFLADRKFDFLS